MDEIDYTDTGFNDFMSMYADNDPNKKMVQNQQPNFDFKSSISTSGSLINDSEMLGKMNGKSEMLGKMNATVDSGKGLLSKAGSGLSKGLDSVGGIGGATEIAAGGLELFKMAKGDNYDTSAEGGGPGSSMAAITGGATTGMKMGAALGPIGMAGGALVGGLIGGLSRASANREYGRNMITNNLKLNEIDKAENAETYQMEQGKESLGLLKGLRQKQLGIFNS